VSCREFDFTFYFEDAILLTIPAAIFLFLLPPRLWHLSRQPVKVLSHRLAVYKIVSKSRKAK
jgi:hypothetical protein